MATPTPTSPSPLCQPPPVIPPSQSRYSLSLRVYLTQPLNTHPTVTVPPPPPHPTPFPLFTPWRCLHLTAPPIPAPLSVCLGGPASRGHLRGGEEDLKRA